MNPGDINPVAILRDFEERCTGGSLEQPGKAESRNEWSGIGYRVGGNYLVTRLGEVVEILDLPELTRVPLTKPWVLGVANVRGNLLPVVDLQGMLSGTMARQTGRTRLLVVDHEGVYSGLVVDEVLGLKHFSESEHTDEADNLDGYLSPYTRRKFRSGDRTWTVFSLFALAESPDFLQAAV